MIIWILVGTEGATLNPKKFKFAQTEIDFTGFFVFGTDFVKSLSKYLQPIKEFPRPNFIGDIRAWIDLVNQVLH